MAIEAIDTITGVNGKEIKVYDANYDQSQMDQEGFLKVLLTSFQYQDPFETQDINKFIENTVKLRELEVMRGFEDSVSMLNDNNTLFFNTTNLIDKNVLYKGNETYVENGKSEIAFELAEDAPQATVYIYDEEGEVVATKEFTTLNAHQRYSFELDDPEIADGYYEVSVVAKSGEEKIDATVYSTAKITGVQKDGLDILALFEKGQIKINEIEKIGG